MAFLDYNLANMRGIDEKRNQMSSQAFQREGAAKGRFFENVGNLVSTLGRRSEAEKQRGFKAGESEKERQARIKAAGLLATARTGEISGAETFEEDIRYPHELALQKLRNLGSGAKEADYDVLGIVQRIRDDMLGQMDSVWDENGQFKGWVGVDKDSMLAKFEAGLDLTPLSPEQKESAKAYFMSFLNDIENGDVSKEAAEGTLQSFQSSKYYTDLDIPEYEPTEEELGNPLLGVKGRDTNTQKWNFMRSMLTHISGNPETMAMPQMKEYIRDASDGKIEPGVLDNFIDFLRAVGGEELYPTLGQPLFSPTSGFSGSSGFSGYRP